MLTKPERAAHSRRLGASSRQEESFISFDHIDMAFGSHRVVNGLDLQIKRGEFLSLLGPSGSGKTTLLMLLAGFLRPTAGSIRLDGARIDHLAPYRRGMGVVFQNYALFPHMSVAENVAFPLKMRRVGRAERDARVKQALELVQLYHLADRRPTALSGGQQQRVALARALIFEPAVVLMDEPLGALDKQLREQMQLDIRDLHRRLGLTIVFVTHDQTEALTMSDRIAVFNNGQIEQIASPADIYDRPVSRFVAEFIGETNLMRATPQSRNEHATTVLLDNGHLLTASPASHDHVAGDLFVSLRPECISVHTPADTTKVADARNTMPAQITDCVYHGDHLRLHLTCAGTNIVARLNRHSPAVEVGAKVMISFRPSDCWIITK